MAKEDEIYQIMENIVIAGKHPVAKIAEFKQWWTPGPSLINNTYKAMVTLTNLKKLVKVDNYFRLPQCESEYKNHAKLLTTVLCEMYCLGCELVIHREHTIKEKGLRPDAVILLKRNNEGRCVILEVLDNEEKSYLESKIKVWKHWNEATEYLTDLFKVKIPHYEIVAYGTDYGIVKHFNQWKEEL